MCVDLIYCSYIEFSDSDDWGHKISTQSKPVMHQRLSSEYIHLLVKVEQYVSLQVLHITIITLSMSMSR